MIYEVDTWRRADTEIQWFDLSSALTSDGTNQYRTRIHKIAYRANLVPRPYSLSTLNSERKLNVKRDKALETRMVAATLWWCGRCLLANILVNKYIFLRKNDFTPHTIHHIIHSHFFRNSFYKLKNKNQCSCIKKGLKESKVTYMHSIPVQPRSRWEKAQGRDQGFFEFIIKKDFEIYVFLQFEKCH